MGNEDKVAMLLQALNHLHSEYQPLMKAIDRQEEELLLQQWGRRWERERRQRWTQDARN